MPAIFQFEDLLKYTGTPMLPLERPNYLTPEERKLGGKRCRKTISGVTLYGAGNRKNSPVWRAKIHGSDGEKSRRHHKAFTYDCTTREEAAYIATMAHKCLKPWFFSMCVHGCKRMNPARPGDKHYLWNDIWGLWRYALVTGDGGERFIAIAIPGSYWCFITDYREDIYAALVKAPFFCRPTVDKRRVFEPVQPHVVSAGDGNVRVKWLRLSEVVFGERVDLPPERLGTFDYRLESLKGNRPRLPFQLSPDIPHGWTPLIEPIRFNAITPVDPRWAHHHPYARHL